MTFAQNKKRSPFGERFLFCMLLALMFSGD